MINYKIATNTNLFQVETDKQGGGLMTATYPRICQAVAVSNNGFQILEQNGKIFLYNGKLETTTIAGVSYTDVYLFVEKLNEIIFTTAVSSGGGDSTAIIDKLEELITVVDSNSLIEFEVNMSLPANSDSVYDITPAGSEIRDYQVFDLANPSQDISGQVSGVVANLHQLRLYTTIAIPQFQIKGRRTKV